MSQKAWQKLQALVLQSFIFLRRMSSLNHRVKYFELVRVKLKREERKFQNVTQLSAIRINL
jgi:hypothetical protein